jgi:hypothetical protein
MLPSAPQRSQSFKKSEDVSMPPVRLFRVLPALIAIVSLAVVSSPSQAASELPGKTVIHKVDFERHVMGLFGRMGCNAGACHGSFQGKNGFRLSLFGYDPEKDYFALTREAGGRRLNPVVPERSLLLLKATGQIEHGGGRRFGQDSWQYQVFRQWIMEGAPWNKNSGTVASISITPPEYRFNKAGETGQLSVRARFVEGSEEDITAFCDFRTNNDTVAEVTPDGIVRSLSPGDTAVIVSYRGNVLPIRVLVPVACPPDFHYPAVPEVNYIDHEVFAKLRRLNIVPSGLAEDNEFLRRVTIDTIGSLPSPEEVRAFLADSDPNKRTRKIDELLAHPLHAALWATKFSDITGNNTDALEQPQQLKPKRSQMWYDWFRKRLAENRPYDEIVRGVLCATSRDGQTPEEWLKQTTEIEDAAQTGFATAYADRPSLDLFWRRQQAVTVEEWGEKTAAAFMGVRLECAQCHKHPFDRWTQADYRSYANIFAPVTFGVSPEARNAINAENAERKKKSTNTNKNQIVQVREVFIGPGGKSRPLLDPETNKPLPAKALGGPEIQVAKDQDPRVALFDWLKAPENPFFARSFVNRVWGHYFGVGLVDPVDNFSLANPTSNQQLLDALANDFAAHKYEIRHIEETILKARVYQLSSHTNPTNKLDRNNYSHSFVRPMMAEVVVDVLNTALGVKEKFGAEAPPESRAIEVGSTRVQNGNLSYAFRIFGRPPRTTACDCERAMEPALPQTLYLMTDQTLLRKMQVGRLPELLKSKASDDEVLDELFLATLTRLPTAADKERFGQYRGTQKDRQTAFADTLWALINTREFILNH